MSVSDTKLEVLALALAEGASYRTAAEQAGLSHRTACRRMQDPEFRGRVRKIRDRMTQEAIGKLTSGASKAAGRLLDLSESAQSEMVSLLASRTVLDEMTKLSEYSELAARVERLEERLSGMVGKCNLGRGDRR